MAVGEYDPAALEAFKKGLTYVYEAYNDCNCLIELDEEPVKEPDKDALNTILEIILMTNASLSDELYVMRKAVIDGSDTSGFQRTMLVGTDGKIEVNGKSIGLLSIVLEEDSARPMSKTDNEVVYRLDRLGIPLIEIATAPEIYSPEEAGKVARKLGELLRRTGHVKRGLGTIRQDVNVSIAEGARVEVKGVQKLEMIDEYVKRESERQVKLIEIREELKKRGASENDYNSKSKNFENELVNLSELFEGNSESKIIAEGLKKGKQVWGLKLKNFNGLIGKEIQPDRRFGTELANYARVKTKVKGLFHSDELPKYGIREGDVQNINNKLNRSVNDGFVLVVEKENISKNALKVVLDRCKQALKGVPEETRNALEDGNTEYARPLPGAARMYPETDLYTVKIDQKYLSELKKHLPLTIEERKKLYTSKFKLSQKLTDKMVLSNWARFFEELIQKKKFEATTTAVFLLENLAELKRDNLDTDSLTKKEIEELFERMKKGEFQKDVLKEVTRDWLKNKNLPLSVVLKDLKIEKASSGDLQEVIQKIIQKNSQLISEKGMGAMSALMGDAMKEMKGKASGRDISEMLKTEIQKMGK